MCGSILPGPKKEPNTGTMDFNSSGQRPITPNMAESPHQLFEGVSVPVDGHHDRQIEGPVAEIPC